MEIVKYGNYKPVGECKTKKQIILSHTSRDAKNYLASLSFRFNGKNTKIPHYIITRDNKILKLLPENTYSDFTKTDSVNKKSIVICLENLGWLKKEPLTNNYINWIGDIYKEDIFEKKWRDYYFWQPYTDDQIKTTALLCKNLTELLSINNRCVGHNTKIEGIKNFEGVVSHSNYSDKHTDLSPAFDFNIFNQYYENEK